MQVHSDIWDPCSIISKPEFKYCSMFIDNYSLLLWLYLMKNCSELFSVFCTFCFEIKTQFNVSLCVFQSDNTKEYFSKTFAALLFQMSLYDREWVSFFISLLVFLCRYTIKKMVLSKEKIGIFLRLLEHFSFKWKFQRIMG